MLIRTPPVSTSAGFPEYWKTISSMLVSGKNARFAPWLKASPTSMPLRSSCWSSWVPPWMDIRCRLWTDMPP